MKESLFRDCLEILIKDGKVGIVIMFKCRLNILLKNLFVSCKLRVVSLITQIMRNKIICPNVLPILLVFWVLLCTESLF